MKKNILPKIIALCCLLLLTTRTHAYVRYQFSYVDGIANQCSAGVTTPFSFQTTVRIDSITITNWTPGAFDYQIHYAYGNVFTGTPQVGNFTSFQITYNIGISNTPGASNALTNVPMQTVDGYTTTNTSSYTGSSAGISGNGVYTDNSVIINFVTGTTLNATANCISSIQLSTNTPLSINLVQFKAEVKNNTVVLNWITANEKNALNYSLEKSTDFVNWENLGNIKPQHQAENNYSFIDKNPNNGNNAYRLRMEEVSKGSYFSNVIFIGYNNTAGTVKLFPNPVKQGTLRITGLNPYAQINITDITGRVVKTLDPIKETYATLAIDQLVNGMYFVNVSNPITLQKDTYKIMVAH
jgi:hypothetical protein